MRCNQGTLIFLFLFAGECFSGFMNDHTHAAFGEQGGVHHQIQDVHEQLGVLGMGALPCQSLCSPTAAGGFCWISDPHEGVPSLFHL